MTSLGKCLAFHFKYQHEMIHLYWQNQEIDGDDGDASNTGDAQDETPFDAETLKMVALVGEQCNREATVFLQTCGKIIEDHFANVGQARLYRLPNQDWRISYGVWPKQAHKPHLKSKWKMRAGVDIPRPGTEIIVWLWGSGKSDAEKAISGQLQDDSTACQGTGDLSPGHVVLDRIPIPIAGASGFDVECDAFLDQIKNAFARITAAKLDTIYQLL